MPAHYRNSYMLLIFLAAIILTAMPSFADSSAGTNPANTEPGTAPKYSGVVMPLGFQGGETRAQEAISKLEGMDFNFDVTEVRRYEDGLIESVKYSNGSTLDYSYEFSESGEIKSCTIGNNKFKMILRSEKSSEYSVGSEASNSKASIYLEIYDTRGGGGSAGGGNAGGGGADTKNPPVPAVPGPASGTPSPAGPVVSIRYANPGWTLEDAARKPVKFDIDEIKRSIAKASDMKDEALKDYHAKTEFYYNEVAGLLKSKMQELLSEDEALAAVLDGVDNIDREAIDRAAEAVLKAASETDEDAPTIKEVAEYIKELRDRILAAALEIYEDNIAAAVAYINAMIEKLLSSKLALYLNADKDKIEALINLPEIKAQSKK